MMTKDTSEALWERLFLVRVPYIQAVDERFVKTFGTYITGIREIDRGAYEQWITTYMPIIQMAEIFRKGGTVGVIHATDTKTMYEIIDEHLEAWRHQLTFGINIHNAPIDDLILLDRFAHTIYDHAKYHFDPHTINFLGLNQAHIGMTAERMFTPPPTEPTEIAPRESISDFLKEQMTRHKRW